MSLKEPIQDSDLLSELSSKKIPWKEKQLTLKDVQMVSLEVFEDVHVFVREMESGTSCPVAHYWNCPA